MRETGDEVRWRARPVLAAALRLVILGVPLLAGYAATVLSVRLLSSQIADSRWWLVPAAAVSVLACVGVERITRRLLPLAALLKLTMLFPDRAPSRFKLARQAASVRSLQDNVSARHHSIDSAGSSAEMVLTLITALTAHDRRTRGHSERVRVFTDLLGQQLRLPREARDRLRWAALLHDIGKLRVAVEILNKPGRLSSSEWELVAAHPANGERLLGPLVDWLGEWGGAVRHHHENYDGTGYPDGLAGVEICRAARIVAIADSFEVMTAHRAYKNPMATAAARAELARCAGSQFDPAFVRAFLSISLPRLLWAMGPGSLLMNLPLLRAAADTANKGVLATAQSGALAAGAAAVIGGVTVTAASHPHPHPPPVAISPVAVNRATSAPPTPGSFTVSSPTPAASPTQPTPSVVPAAVTSPTTATSGTPVASPPPPMPWVAFTSVPPSSVASGAVSIRFATDPDATRVMCSLDGAAATVCAGGSVSYTGLPDGPHTLTVWAEDSNGVAGSASSISFTVDTTAPTVAFTTVPPAHTNTSDIVVGFTVDDPSATSWCSLDGAPAQVCNSPAVFTGLADGPHSVAVQTTDSVGNRSAAIHTDFVVDTTAPAVSLTSTPPPISNSSSATVDFSSDDPVATIWCSLDAGPPAVCTGAVTYTGLADGPHTVAVHGVDAVGNVGAAASTSFTVDTTAPTVSFTSVPSGIVPSKSVSVSFSVDDPTATAWCSLDGGPAAPCYSPVSYNDLTDGPHTVAVYAIDPAGNQGPAVSDTFTVDSIAPTVTLDSAPPHLTNNPDATLAFSVDDPGATAWCSLDGGAATECTGTVSYTGLADGAHTIAVYAVSAAATQGTTVSTGFTVDTQAPTVLITSAPSGAVQSSSATIAFALDDPTATAYCSVDVGPATPCTSPQDYGSLAEGPHTVSVWAIDPAGNISATDQVSFTIDNTAPTVTLTATPPATSATGNVTVGFGVDDPGAQAWCAVDNGIPQPCSGTLSYSLSDGNHTIGVYAVDAAGNRSATVASTFTIAAAAPVFSSTPPANSWNWPFDTTATFTWTSTPGLTYQYSYDGHTWVTTTTPSSQTSTNLSYGAHTFYLRGTDSAGHHTTTAAYTFHIN